MLLFVPAAATAPSQPPVSLRCLSYGSSSFWYQPFAKDAAARITPAQNKSQVSISGTGKRAGRGKDAFKFLQIRQSSCFWCLANCTMLSETAAAEILPLPFFKDSAPNCCARELHFRLAVTDSNPPAPHTACHSCCKSSLRPAFQTKQQ